MANYQDQAPAGTIDLATVASNSEMDETAAAAAGQGALPGNTSGDASRYKAARSRLRISTTPRSLGHAGDTSDGLDADAIRDHVEGGNRAISIEFASFAKEGHEGSVDEALKHKKLNRYADVLPYDETLVRLKHGVP